MTPIFWFGRSLGDDLLLSGVVREWFNRHRQKSLILSNHPDLFRHNPYVRHVLPYNGRIAKVLNFAGLNAPRLQYSIGDVRLDQFTSPREHILRVMCRKAGLSGAMTIKPDWFFAEGEIRRWKDDAPFICMMTSSTEKAVRMKNKEWGAEKFQEVADCLSEVCEVRQVGHSSDIPLRGVKNFCNKLTLREGAGMLAEAQCFVGEVGFLMHLARAVECPAVIVYGGRELPSQSGYIANRNIVSNPPCSPCWSYNHCDFERKCLGAITSSTVVTEVMELLANPPSRPLPVEMAKISALK